MNITRGPQFWEVAMKALRLSINEIYWTCCCLQAYQQTRGRDYDCVNIIRKLSATIGDIRVSPTEFKLLVDTEKLELLESVSEALR